MAILECLSRLAAQGRISEDARQEAEDIYKGFKAAMPFSSEAEHALNVAKAMEQSADLRRNALYLKAEKTQSAWDRMSAHANGAMAGLRSMLERDPHAVGGTNVPGVAFAWSTHATNTLNAIIDRYGSKMAGLKGEDVAGLREVIHEMRGTGNGKDGIAASAGKGWEKLFGRDGMFVTEAQKRGAVFHAAEDWGTPQFWDSARARKFGARQFISDRQGEIDAGLMAVMDPATHQPAAGARASEIVAAIADKIVKDLPWEGGARTAFAPDMRMFRYKTTRAGTDAYIKAMEKYGPGQGGWLGMLQGHVDRASHNLAMLDMFGPDTAATLDGLLKKATEHDLEGKFQEPQTLKGKLKGLNLNPLETDYATRKLVDYTLGRTSQVANATVANFMGGYRGFTTARKLGGGTVTAFFQDQSNMIAESQWLGMNTGRMWQNIMSSMFTGMDEKELGRVGIISQGAADQAIGTKQFADQWLGQSLGRRLGSLVVRGSGLAHWDKVLRSVFQQEFLSAIGDRAGISFDKLEGPFKDHLVTPYGFTPDEWSILSDPANHMSLGGVRMLDPDRLSATGNEDLRQKLLSALHDERQFGYIVGGSNRVRALTQGAPAGSIAGEGLRNTFLFKTWPATYMSTWVGRALQQEGWAAKLPIITKLAIFAASSGAMTMAAKAVISGKDIPDMTDPWFWVQAEIQGGIAGLASDYVRDAFSRDNTTLAESLLGPMSSDIKDVTDLLSKSSREIGHGENVSWGSALARDMRDVTPGNTLWYARLIAQRLIFDQWQKMIDPEAEQSFQRQRDRIQKLNNQDFYWLPGETSPQRAPSFGPSQ